MAPDRIPIVQEMIMADTAEEREAALAKLMPMQEEDFYGILKAMDGFPVTIRLLDPPYMNSCLMRKSWRLSLLN